MTLAQANARSNETFIVQGQLTIVTYDRQNMFIVQATGIMVFKMCLFCLSSDSHQKVVKILFFNLLSALKTERFLFFSVKNASDCKIGL